MSKHSVITIFVRIIILSLFLLGSLACQADTKLGVNFWDDKMTQAGDLKLFDGSGYALFIEDDFNPGLDNEQAIAKVFKAGLTPIIRYHK